MDLPPLGRVGLWTVALDGVSSPRAQELATEIDELGYGALWFGEAYGREAFTQAATLLAATRRLTIATGIASIYGRDAVTANAAARTLTAAHPGRFLLGLGVSHVPMVERVRGHDYGRPLSAMREYLDRMDAAPYMAADAAPEPPPRVLAALGPKMLALSAERAQGAHPYLVTPAHTRGAREILGDGPILAVEQAAVLSDDRELALQRAHAHLEIYTGLPNYRNSWLREGFGAEDLVRGGSERLAEALVVRGDEAAIRARVEEHLDAGASHVCVQVLGEHVLSPPAEEWRRLAPALLGT
jgi:probable F420-dependent oxidoreductase